MQPADEEDPTTPLVPKGRRLSVTERVSQGASKAKEAASKAADTVIERTALYEPHEPGVYLADNPTPLRLFFTTLGPAVIEVSSVFGSYLFLNSHIQLLFPKCSDYAIMDSIIGTSMGHGVLCELCSLALWSFPLVCCMAIPFIHYWEMCDARLYYECLREKMLIKFAPRDFFVSPLFAFLVMWMLVGISAVIFGGAKDWGTLADKAQVIMGFIFPVFSFLLSVYLAWDIKFFLITLSNFSAYDLRWAGNHLVQCLGTTEEEVHEAYERLRFRKELKVETSRETIVRLREEVKAIQAEKGRDDDLVPEPAEEGVVHSLAHSKKRIFAIMFWQDGFWLMDLFWLPTDQRGKDFRYTLRWFCIAVWVMEGFVFMMLLSTVIMYLETQGYTVFPWIHRVMGVRDAVLKGQS